MVTINVRLYPFNSIYPKDLANICLTDINPTYKMFPIDLGNGEQIQITLERQPKT